MQTNYLEIIKFTLNSGEALGQVGGCASVQMKSARVRVKRKMQSSYVSHAIIKT